MADLVGNVTHNVFDLQIRATAFPPLPYPILYVSFFSSLFFFFLLSLPNLHSSVSAAVLPDAKCTRLRTHADVDVEHRHGPQGSGTRKKLRKQTAVLSLIWPSRSRADLIAGVDMTLRETARGGGRRRRERDRERDIPTERERGEKKQRR